MSDPALPSIVYEVPGQPSLYERWEAGDPTAPIPPLAVRSERYRSRLTRLLRPHRTLDGTLISVGAGNGFAEAALAADGWTVLATDVAEAALRACRDKGLRAQRFDLLRDHPPGTFDAIYADGLFGHLWHPVHGLQQAWLALTWLGHAGSVALVSNDLADDDSGPQFAVRASEHARFLRPPLGDVAADARATGRWAVLTQVVHHFERNGEPRRRELILARLLMDDRVEAEDGPELGAGQG